MNNRRQGSPEALLRRVDSLRDFALLNFGDVVLVGFPHTDLRGVSKRPAFVIYDSGDLDWGVQNATKLSSIFGFRFS